ncbi:MAG TPA: RDD family protein [Methylomirabilota bacterium]|jgi:uncharacterized RDD family membrane protein YckC|nr:RDD family protein [Methylomirabilota bacterium]
MNDVASRPAGFWIRLLALVIDVGVIMLAEVLLGAIAARRWDTDLDRSPALHALVAFFTLLFAVLYPTVLHAVAGQTIGKLVVGARVVATDGEALPLGAALARAVAFWLSVPFTLGLGPLLGGLRKDKRALHDLVAGSRVERVHRPPRRVVRAAPAPVAPAYPAAPPESRPIV